MREALNFDSYNDSWQARHLKSWVKQHSIDKKGKLPLTEETCVKTEARSDLLDSKVSLSISAPFFTLK